MKIFSRCICSYFFFISRGKSRVPVVIPFRLRLLFSWQRTGAIAMLFRLPAASLKLGVSHWKFSARANVRSSRNLAKVSAGHDISDPCNARTNVSQSLPKRSSPVTAIAHIENRWRKPAKCSERRQSERTLPLQLIELPNIPRSSAGMRKLHHHHWPARFWFAQLWLHAFGHNFAFSLASTSSTRLERKIYCFT